MGDEKDNSVFEIIDAINCEQVAEFYSNIIPAHVFAQVVAQVATMFNNALVIGEEDKWGKTILDKLQGEISYDNLFYTVQKGSEKVGVCPSKKTRPALMELLQARLLTRSIMVRSRRLVYELKNFVYNDTTETPQADRGYHDDAIMSLSYALYARDHSNKYLPVGAIMETPTDMTERYKVEIYEEIKAELAKGAPEDWFETDDKDDDDPLDINWDDYHDPGIRYKYKRRHDSILKEFNW